jgi:hypothetical protein
LFSFLVLDHLLDLFPIIVAFFFIVLTLFASLFFDLFFWFN